MLTLLKCGYSGYYGIGFDARLDYSLPNDEINKNVILFGIEHSSWQIVQ